MNNNQSTLIPVVIKKADVRRSSKIQMADVYYNGIPLLTIPLSNVAHILEDQDSADALYDRDLGLFYQLRK